MIYVIIPVHNRLNFTIDCLNSLIKQNNFNQLKIIVVDDGSTDGTSNYLKKNFPEVKVLNGSGSLYWGGAINFGVKHVLNICDIQDWILIVNNDVELTTDAVSVLINFSKKKKRKVLLGSLTLSAKDRKTIIKSGTIIENWFLNRTNHIYKGLDISQITNKSPVKVDLLTGRCLLHPVEIFKKAGNYDSKNFLHYGADDEFSFRVKKYGFECMVCPNSIVYLKSTCKKKKILNLKKLFFTFFDIKSSSNIINKFKLSFKIAPFYARFSFFVIGVLKSLFIFFSR